MSYFRTVAPATEPLSLTEVKLHLRVDQSSEDSWITDKIVAARETAENITRRGLITQTWELALDGFPSYVQAAPSYSPQSLRSGIIRIEKAPVSAVTSIVYVDTNGNSQTLAGSDYTVDLKSLHPRIAPAYGKSWPSTRCVMNAVTVTFTVGYGGASAVPAAIKEAMLLLIGGWYQSREAVVVGVSVQELPCPLAVKAILWQYRAKVV